MNDIESKLLNKHIKPTAMRELVLKILSEQTSAVNLSDIEKKFDKADRGTLYRTLKTFEENKLIHSINDGTGSLKYALCSDTCQCNPEDLHVHFLCTQCQQTFCLNHVAIPTLQLPSGFAIGTVNLVVKGTCPSCS